MHEQSEDERPRVPTCPRCAAALRPAGTVLQPFWDCRSCGFYAADALLSYRIG